MIRFERSLPESSSGCGLPRGLAPLTTLAPIDALWMAQTITVERLDSGFGGEAPRVGGGLGKCDVVLESRQWNSWLKKT